MTGLSWGLASCEPCTFWLSTSIILPTWLLALASSCEACPFWLSTSIILLTVLLALAGRSDFIRLPLADEPFLCIIICKAVKSV